MEYPKCMVCLELYAVLAKKASLFLKNFFLSRKIDKKLVFVLCIWYDMGTLPGLDTVDPQEIKPC